MLSPHPDAASLTEAEGDDVFARLRATEFARLDEAGLTYLDYTGSALYAASHVRQHAEQLVRGVYGNPHAESDPSRDSTAVVEEARRLVLRFFHADAREYTVLFTANASQAIRVVAESWPFGPGAHLALAADNHNSVNGLREVARAECARVTYLPLDEALRLDQPLAHLPRVRNGARALFALPAQSNFSGVQHPMTLVSAAQALGWEVLLDAASFVPTNRMDLREVQPDYVPISFYKMFGYPTGLGALLVRRRSLARMTRPWFAGGTVLFASVQQRTHLLRDGAEGFEDGTPDFLGLAALPCGFALLDRLGMAEVQGHVRRLTGQLIHGLRALRHANGAPKVWLHGPATLEGRGGTVALNVVGRQGAVIPYLRVEEEARRQRIAVRGGCFCNPGAAESAFGFRREHARSALLAATRDAPFTIERFAAQMSEVPVGAIRVSVGIPTNAQDVERVIDLLDEIR
jgi:selenocysteine lyase/cysteine desulfurase